MALSFAGGPAGVVRESLQSTTRYRPIQHLPAEKNAATSRWGGRRVREWLGGTLGRFPAGLQSDHSSHRPEASFHSPPQSEKRDLTGAMQMASKLSVFFAELKRRRPRGR
jgi:hypothetical protein